MFQNKTRIMYSSRFISEICNANTNIPIIFPSLNNYNIILLSKAHFLC